LWGHEEFFKPRGMKSGGAKCLKRKIVETVNNQLVVYMRAMSQVNEAVYGDFARTLAEIIADNNEVVKKRAKKTEPVE